MINSPNKYYRLYIGNEVRLMGAYFIKATSYETDAYGNITTIHATYDKETKQDGRIIDRKVKGTIHFVEATTAIPAEFRLLEPLLLDETEENKDLDFMDRLNPESLNILNGYVEESLKDTKELDHFQFIRNGYYVTDKDSTKDKLVFNRTCGLKSSFKL